MRDRVMYRNLSLVTAPEAEPVSLADAKVHLRVTTGDEDSLIDALIHAARELLDGRDGWLNRTLVTQTWDYTLDAFPVEDWIPLPLPPVQEVTAITYEDINGNLQTFGSSNYSLSADKEWAPRVLLAANASWPATWDEPEAVTIRMVNGYGDAAEDVPAPIRQAMLLLIGHWYENRETINIGNITSSLPFAVEALLTPYMVTAF
jgi:uncharacterized phiE125 gp8 family phage protein